MTEHEQLGMQSWLDAYHGVTSGHEGVLVSGDLAGRAGSIQAAINLELHSMTISSIDVKVEIAYNFFDFTINIKKLINFFYSRLKD